jgi:hypothetical protein
VEQHSGKELNYACQMTPYEKRFQSLQRKYRIVTAQVKASDNAADIAWLKEHRAAIVVEAREIINKPN